MFGLGFVAGPLVVEAALRVGDARPVLASFSGVMVLGALAVWITLDPRRITLSEVPPGADPPRGVDAVYPLLYAKVLYGFALAFAASHVAERFPSFGIAGLMLAMSVVFIVGQALGSVIARRAPRAWLIVALPLLAAAIVAAYVVTGAWWIFMALSLTHSVLILVAYAGVAGTPSGPRAFALFNCLSDPGMLVGSALAGLGLAGGWGVAALGLVPLCIALARPSRYTRTEQLIPFIGPVAALKMVLKQRDPSVIPVDDDTAHLDGLDLEPWRHTDAPRQGERAVTLLLGGDLATTLEHTRWDEPLADLIRGHDLSALNLEGAAGDADTPPRQRFVFELPGPQLDALVGTSDVPLFDAASVVNNHALDRGAASVGETAGRLSARGVTPIDSVPRVLEVGPLRVGVLACTFGVNFHRRTHDRVAVVPLVELLAPRDTMSERAGALLARVEALSEQVDLVMLSYHWGFESEYAPSKLQSDAWRVLRAAGVGILYGHHSHIVQPFAVGEGGADLCLYSCGNLRMEMNFQRVYAQGALFSIELLVDEEGAWRVGAVTPRWFEHQEGALRALDPADALARARWASAQPPG